MFNHGITFYKVLLLINHINLQESVEIDREATKQLAWMEKPIKTCQRPRTKSHNCQPHPSRVSNVFFI